MRCLYCVWFRMCDVWMCVPLRMYAENYCVCVCVCELCVYAWRQDGLGLYISLVHGVPSGCRVLRMYVWV